MLDRLAKIAIQQTEESNQLFVPAKKEATGILSVQVDSALMTRTFFDRTLRNILSALIPLIFLAFTLVLMFYYSLTKPLVKLSLRLRAVDIKQPILSKLDIPRHHDSDELAQVIVTITCQFIKLQNLTHTTPRRPRGSFPAMEERLYAHLNPVGEPLHLASGSGTILRVDDEEKILTTVEAILHQCGHQTFSAASGEYILAISKDMASNIDLILLDLGRPGMGGKKCLKERLELNPGVRVILVSGYGNPVS